MEYVYNSDRVKEIINSEDSSGLEDALDIEDLMAKIFEIDKDIFFFKKQKKKRTKILDDQIRELESQKNFIKDVIKNTLSKHNEKSLTFPSVGTVKAKDGYQKWVVNENKVMDLINSIKEHLSEDFVSQLIKEKPAIDKRNLDSLLNEWEETGTWPSSEFENIVKSCITKEEIPSTINTYFEKDTQVEPDKDIFNENKNQEDNSNNLDDLFGEIKLEDL